MIAALAAFFLCIFANEGAAQDHLRVATYHTELAREGPGLLLRDIRRGDAQTLAVAAIVARTAPDILVLQGIDYDLDLLALTALRDRIAAAGHEMPHVFALRPNTGMATGLDMDDDGRRGGPRDAQGYGPFAGEGGMAILSRYPFDWAGLRDHSATLWADLPWADPPRETLSPEILSRQRLSTTGHWQIPVLIGDRRLTLLTFHASPPAFDGPEDRNKRRNHDEIVFWQHLLDGRLGPPPVPPFVLLGVANLDPIDGDGRKRAILDLLSDPRFTDAQPTRPAAHGPTGLDTVHWPAPGPGSLRASYLLPSADVAVTDAQIHWPPDNSAAGLEAAQASRHRLIWADLMLP